MSEPKPSIGLPGVIGRFSRDARWRGVPGLVTLVLALAGCNPAPNTLTVALQVHVHSVRDGRVLEVRAEPSAPRAGLVFKWFADQGRCTPQESSVAMTLFRFAEGTRTDGVTVEVWQNGVRLTSNRLVVKAGPTAAAEPARQIQVEITEVPFSDTGGPDTRTNISGRVTGQFSSEDRVVIYARDNGVWWIQPTVFEKHEIRADGTWATWTHSGQAYAAVVVRSDFDPLRTLDTLPKIDGEVLARTAVEGRKK